VITVTEDARDLFREVDNPDGTVLRLDPVTAEGVTAETQVRLGIGEPKNNDQVVQHEGEDLLRIARPLSEALNGSAIDLVEILEGPALAIKPPDNGLPVSDGY
jgi:iron-sulfur cluster assembly protein